MYFLFLATAGNAEPDLKKKSLNEEMEIFREVDRKFDSVLRPDSLSFIATPKKKYPQLIQESEVAVKMAQNNTWKEKEKTTIQIDKTKTAKESTSQMKQKIQKAHKKWELEKQHNEIKKEIVQKSEASIKMKQKSIEKEKEMEEKQINSIKKVKEKTEKMIQNFEAIEKIKTNTKMTQNKTNMKKKTRMIQIDNVKKTKKIPEKVAQNIERAQKKWHLEKQRNALKKHGKYLHDTIRGAKNRIVANFKKHHGIKKSGAISQKVVQNFHIHLLLILCVTLFRN